MGFLCVPVLAHCPVNYQKRVIAPDMWILEVGNDRRLWCWCCVWDREGLLHPGLFFPLLPHLALGA